MADRNYKPSTKAYTKESVDKYFPGPSKIKTPEYSAIARILARHEAINGRFKEFGCLSQLYSHDKAKHHLTFKAVAVINQIELRNGRPDFEKDTCNIKYEDYITNIQL